MTPEEERREEVKAFTAEIGRATVEMVRRAAEIPSMANVDGRTALLIFAESLEQSVEERTL